MDIVKFCNLLGIMKIEFMKCLNKNWRDVCYFKLVFYVFLDKILVEMYVCF